MSTGAPERAARGAWVFWGVGALIALAFALLYFAQQPLLLAFAGVLFATSLRGVARQLSARLHWRLRWSLVACVGLLLYLGVNLADGYGLTPWLQKRAVALPLAFILRGQVVMGALFGVLGVTLATPLLAYLLVLVQELVLAPAAFVSRG